MYLDLKKLFGSINEDSPCLPLQPKYYLIFSIVSTHKFSETSYPNKTSSKGN